MHPYCSELPFHHRVSLILVRTVIDLITENGQLFAIQVYTGFHFR